MKIFKLFFFLFLICLLQKSHGQGQTLTVTIGGVINEKGVVRGALYNSEKEFMKAIWMDKSTPAKRGSVEMIFENIPPGTYALSVIHDINENGKMDSNMAGIPKEGFGFSNNAVGMFGPPSFEEAKFVIEGPKKMEITLKYY